MLTNSSAYWREWACIETNVILVEAIIIHNSGEMLRIPFSFLNSLNWGKYEDLLITCPSLCFSFFFYFRTSHISLAFGQKWSRIVVYLCSSANFREADGSTRDMKGYVNSLGVTDNDIINYLGTRQGKFNQQCYYQRLIDQSDALQNVTQLIPSCWY